MSWWIDPVPKEEVHPSMLYDLTKKHRLLMENLDLSIAGFRAAIGSLCTMVRIRDEQGDEVASVIISGVVDGEYGFVDLIPVPKYFTPEERYEDKINEALSPLLERLMEARSLRRLTSRVPKSRSRTAHALRACGFHKEGVERDAIKLVGREPEGVVIMGLLPGRSQNGTG